MAGRRGSAPSRLLLLCAALAIGSASAVINLGAWELLGRQQNCWGPNNAQADKQVPNPTGLTEAQCYQCVEDAAQTSTTPFDKTFGCWTYCQANSTVMPTVGAAEQCRQCIVSGDVQDPYACQTCIFDTCTKDASGAIVSCDSQARDRCYSCVKSYPKGPGSKEYYYSCSACASLFGVEEAYQHCIKCVNLVLAPNGQGVLPQGWGDPYQVNQVPLPAYQFGKCVAEGQLIRAIVRGEEKPTGVQSLCFDAEDKYAGIIGMWRPTRTPTLTTVQPPVGACTSCVYRSYSGQFDPIRTSPKSYGCAEYCMDPSLVHNEDQMDQCVNCIINPLITDPWGCQNCMAVNNAGPSTSANDEINRVSRQKCMDCLTQNPYNNVNFTNYPWACGQCAAIPTGARQDACYSCIQNKTDDYPIYTSDQLCECVDATVNAGTSFDRGLDAFERSCLANWTVDVLFGAVDLQMIYLTVNATLTAADKDALNQNYLGQEVYQNAQNPRWALHRLGGYIDTAIADTCLTCMATQKKALTSDTSLDKRYACRQYCMDPQLILTVAQAQQCSKALDENRIRDAWGVHNCLVVSTTILNYTTTSGYPLFTPNPTGQAATAPTDGALIQQSIVDSDIRDWCFDVLKMNPLKYDSFPWGVGQCAQIKPSAAEILQAGNGIPFSQARADCMACLIAGLVDPCQCVEDAQNPPDLPDVPVGSGGCQQPTLNTYLVPNAVGGGFTCAPCPDGTSNPNFADPAGSQTPGSSNPNDRWAQQVANPNYYGAGQGFYFCLCDAPKTRQSPAPVVGASTGIFPPGATASPNDFQCLCPTGQWYKPGSGTASGTCNTCPVGTHLTSNPLCSTSTLDCCICDGAANMVLDPTATAAPFCKCAPSVVNGYVDTTTDPDTCKICPAGTALPTAPPPANPVTVEQCLCTGANTVRVGDSPNYSCECAPNYYLLNGVCTSCPDGSVKKDSGNDKTKCVCPNNLVLSGDTCVCPASAPNLIMDGTTKKCVTCSSITWVASYDATGKTCVCTTGHGIFNTRDLSCLDCPDKDLDKFCNCPPGMKNKKFPGLPKKFSDDCGCEDNEEQNGKTCSKCDDDKEIDPTTKKCVCKTILRDSADDKGEEDKSKPKHNQCVCKGDWWMDTDYRCRKCNYGKHSGKGSRGFDKCVCLPGASIGKDEDSCKCPKDSYMTATGCVPCPGNTRTQGRGATSITQCDCHPKLTKVPAGATVATSKCYCPKETYGPGDDDDSKCQKCPLGSTSDLGDDQRRSDYNCRCKHVSMKKIRGADDKCEKDKNKYFCACPPGTVFNPLATDDASVCVGCTAGTGGKSCLGGTKCGYKLFLEVSQPGSPTCTGRKMVATDVLSCWQQRASILPGFIQQCTEEAQQISDCSVKGALIFDTVDNLKAAVLYFRNLKPNSVTPYKEYFPDASFVNTCAKLPCGVQMKMYPDSDIPSLATFYPKNLFYTCGTSKYNDLPAGHSNMPSDALCSGTDNDGKTIACGCNTCPAQTFWHWDRSNNRYKYGGGSVGKCGKKYFKDGTADECQEFHGACCAKFKNGQPGRCPSHTCAGNEMGDNDAMAGHACTCSGSCGKFSLSSDNTAPKCTKSSKKLLRQLLGASEEEADAHMLESETPDLLEIAQNALASAGRDLLDSCDGKYASADKGYCSDKKNFGIVTQSYGAFCDITVYGGNYLDTGKTPRNKNCLGRVTCHKNGVKGSCATLYPGTDVAKVADMDCFTDIDADDWKLCNWHYHDNDKCKTYDPTLPMCSDTADWCQPGVWRVDRWNNGATYGTPASWKQVSTGVDSCNPTNPGNCHGFCDTTTGVCPTYSCSNPNAAHINTNNLGPVESICAVQADSGGNKYCTGSGKDQDGNDRDDTCPFYSKTQYARCLKYNTGCDSKTKVCLGRVTCHTAGGTPTPCLAADGVTKLASWDGIDCMLPISSSGDPKEFKICGCNTPQNVFVTDSKGKVTKKCGKGSDGGKPEGDDKDDRNTEGKPSRDFKSCKKIQEDSRKDGGKDGAGCWQDWSRYRSYGDS